MLYSMDELSHFSQNEILIPVTPDDPRLTFDPINGIDLKLMHISYMNIPCITVEIMHF